jgi:Na+/H+-translocating membrane pyrophosphatase
MDLLAAIVIGYFILSAILGSVALWTDYEHKQKQSTRTAADAPQRVER